MASTSPASNNKSVAFRGKSENEMPPYPKPVSQAQNAAMHAAASGKSTIGIPKKVGKEFAKGAKKTSVKKLPQHVDKARAGRAMKRGAISETAAKKHLGEY
jgi:hypothetical protein